MCILQNNNVAKERKGKDKEREGRSRRRKFRRKGRRAEKGERRKGNTPVYIIYNIIYNLSCMLCVQMASTLSEEEEEEEGQGRREDAHSLIFPLEYLSIDIKLYIHIYIYIDR